MELVQSQPPLTSIEAYLFLLRSLTKIFKNPYSIRYEVYEANKIFIVPERGQYKLKTHIGVNSMHLPRFYLGYEHILIGSRTFSPDGSKIMD